MLRIFLSDKLSIFYKNSCKNEKRGSQRESIIKREIKIKLADLAT